MTPQLRTQIEAALEELYYCNSTEVAKQKYDAALAALSAEPVSESAKPYAWRNPLNGVCISDEQKNRKKCVGNGYPNFSEPLYAAGAAPQSAVPLTDEQIAHFYENSSCSFDFARAVESAHGITQPPKGGAL